MISIMFEVVEYTLEHQLPNFSECWWDHVSIPVGFLHLSSSIFSVVYQLALYIPMASDGQYDAVLHRLQND